MKDQRPSFSEAIDFKNFKGGFLETMQVRVLMFDGVYLGQFLSDNNVSYTVGKVFSSSF